MDLLDRMIDSIETLNLFTTFSIDVMKDNDNALTIRQAPSSPSIRFLDNSFDNVLLFQILVKHTDQKIAINTLEIISNHIENISKLPSNDGSYEFIKCEKYTNPLLVEKSDRGFYIYTAMFQTIININ